MNDKNNIQKFLDSMKLPEGINLQNSELMKSTFQLPNNDKFDFDNSPIVNHRQEEKMYWEQSLSLLKNIETNTANFGTLVDLIAKGNEKQDEIIKLISEFLEIAKESDKYVAETKYSKAMKKIGDIANNADTMVKLYGFGQMIGTILQVKGII